VHDDVIFNATKGDYHDALLKPVKVLT